MARFTIAQAAAQTHVSKDTLRRWEAQKKIPRPRRDRNNARFYTDEDLARIRVYRDAERAI